MLTCESPLGEIRIVDFGLSRVMKNSEELREIMGTPEYVGMFVIYMIFRANTLQHIMQMFELCDIYQNLSLRCLIFKNLMFHIL